MKKCAYCNKNEEPMVLQIHLDIGRNETKYICLNCQVNQDIAAADNDPDAINKIIQLYEQMADQMNEIIKDAANPSEPIFPFTFAPTCMYDSIQKVLLRLKTEHLLTDTPEKLKAGIKAAVAREDYEKAAELKRLLDQMEMEAKEEKD